MMGKSFYNFYFGGRGPLLALLLGLAFLSPGAGEAAQPVWGGAPDRRAVALTFDDGPSVYTLKILALLARYQARGTFFVVGSHVEKYPEVVRALVRAGEELGNHSFSHPRLTEVDQAARERELERTDLDLDLLVGPHGHDLFRPPYSAYDERLLTYLEHTHRRLVLWGVDSGDWRGLRAPQIIANVLPRVRPGAIVIFHDGDEAGQADRSPTVAALTEILPALQRAGYRLVTVSELLALARGGKGPVSGIPSPAGRASR